MRNFLNDFEQLYKDAVAHVTEQMKDKTELVLVDLYTEGDDDCVNDEVYEMPTQHFYRKYDIIPYKVYKLTKDENGTIWAHGYDTECGDDQLFKFDENNMDWDCIITVAGLI